MTNETSVEFVEIPLEYRRKKQAKQDAWKAAHPTVRMPMYLVGPFEGCRWLQPERSLRVSRKIGGTA